MEVPPDFLQEVSEVGGGAWNRTTDLRIMSREPATHSTQVQQDARQIAAKSCKIRNPRATGFYRLWREHGRQQLESFRLAPWASRRDLLELMDRLNPTITELSQAIEHEVEKCPEAKRLMTHPGVGALTALAFVLII
jgi:transposase